jgi:GT2 family glycosyltransferase
VKNNSMASTVELAIVIVNWNTRELLLGCLKTILEHPPARAYEIWVVDNGSTDGSVEAVRQQYPRIQIIANTQNTGFAAANNQAIEVSTGRYILLLNSDTEVLSEALERMCIYMDEHPEVGASGCRLLNGDGTLQRSCWRGYPGLRSTIIDGFYLWRLFPTLFSKSEVTLANHQTPQSVDHLLGACMLVRRSVIDVVGPLDPNYYMYLEETDWCWEIRTAGWQIMYLPEPRIVHFGQQSAHKIEDRLLPIGYASLCRFIRKRNGRWLGLRLLLLKVVIALSVILRIGLWTVRLVQRPQLSQRMISGYSRVLLQLPTL